MLYPQGMAFTLAHLSDPHLAPLPKPHWIELIGKRVTGYINWQRRRRFLHDPQVLAQIVADMKSANPDHIAVTGDIANLALPDEFAHGREWLNALGPPHDVSFVPGNHDMYVGDAVKMLPEKWGAFMLGDSVRGGIPYVRRRGDVALIGVSSGVPTAPFLATGWIGATQLNALRAHLLALGNQGLFRVVMIHHPPISEAGKTKRLLDAPIFLRVIAEAGAELILHGHDHIHSLVRLKGPHGPVPAIGVPSASQRFDGVHTPAAYNLYCIERSPAGWQCQTTSRGLDAAGNISELGTIDLFAG
jgi:3',5'-cyclic AMP phosphodiesterase CpdA